MTQQNQDKSLNHAATELLTDNGFEGAEEAIAVLYNTAMAVERSAYLDAQPYERTAERRGYAITLNKPVLNKLNRSLTTSDPDRIARRA